MMKLLRAREHFVALEAAVWDWNVHNELLAPVRRSPRAANVLEVFCPHEPWIPLIVWGCLFGDGIHNLRSALDALVFEMCHVDGDPQHPDRIAFPANVKSPQQWAKATRHLEALAPVTLARLRSMQAWSGSPRAQVASTLALLHGLDIEDKHRSAIGLHPVPGVVSLDEVRDWPDGLEIVADNRVWMTVAVDRELEPDDQPSVWPVPIVPAVAYRGQVTPALEFQRWLLRETYRVVMYMATGEDATADAEAVFLDGYVPSGADPQWAAMTDPL